MSEQMPTILGRGDTVVDIGFTEWEEREGEWRCVEGTVLTAGPEGASWFVVELPIGCFTAPIYTMLPGTTLTLRPSHDKATALAPCRRARHDTPVQERAANPAAAEGS